VIACWSWVGTPIISCLVFFIKEEPIKPKLNKTGLFNVDSVIERYEKDILRSMNTADQAGVGVNVQEKCRQMWFDIKLEKDFR
jgi:hypothetical protein